jgi:23S rRNA (adenine2503-C2)-methyltransferase
MSRMNRSLYFEGGTTPLDGSLVFEASPRGRPPRHWADLSPVQRREQVEALGHSAYRARQLSAHYFEGLRDDPAEWTDLPAGERAAFAAKFLPRLLTPVRELSCDGDLTVKTLWRMHDGALVESVLMRYPDRVTMCVSSQAGCGMACPFCATGQGGLQRNMSTAEIVEQVMDGERKLRRGLIPGGSGRVGNVVFMGMGEPLANYKAVIGAVRQLHPTVLGSVRVASRSQPSGWYRGCSSLLPKESRSPSRSRSMHLMTSSATSWYRSIPAGMSRK